MKKILFISLLFLLFYNALQAQWTEVVSGTTDEIHDVQFVDANIGFYVGPGIFKTTDGGNTWNKLNFQGVDSNYFNGCLFYCLDFFNENTGIIAGWVYWDNTQIILKTTDGGINWTMVCKGTNMSGWRFKDIYFISSSIGIAVGTNGLIMKTTDGGDTWSYKTSGTTNDIEAIDFFDASDGIAVGNNIILKTNSSGDIWTSNSSPYGLKTVFCTSSTAAYMAGDNGIVMKTTDGGTNWNLLNTFTNTYFTDMYFTSLDTGYVVGGGRILQTLNGGTLWEQNHVNCNLLNTITFANQNLGITAGFGGKMFRTQNMGGGYLPISSFYSDETNYCIDSVASFLNNGPAFYTYEWLINDTLFSTNFNANYIFTNENSSETISLVAHNATGADTSSLTIHTESSLHIDLITTVLKDTICPGENTYINVINSEPDATYSLWKNGIPIGSSYSGNGDTLALFSNNIDSTSTFDIVAEKSNVCGSNQVIGHETIYVIPPVTNLNITSSDNIICQNDSVNISVLNSVPGTSYLLYSGGLFTGDTLTGNNGTITFNSGTINNTTIFYIHAINQYGCEDTLDSSITVDVDTINVFFSFANNDVFAGDTVIANNTSNADNYLWITDTTTYINNDTIPNPYFIFNETGNRNIKLIGNTDFGCSDSMIIGLDVFEHPAHSNGSYCFFDTISQLQYPAGNQEQIYDYHVDSRGNSYIGGCYYIFYGINGKQCSFLKKYNSNGNLVWEKIQDPMIYWNGEDNYMCSFVTGITTDDDMNVYITGSYTSNQFTIDTISIVHGGVYPQFYIAKLDSNGICQWIIHSDSPYSTIRGGTDILHLSNNHIMVSLFNPISGVFPDGSTHSFNSEITLLEIDSNGNYINSFLTGLYYIYANNISVFNPNYGFSYSDRLATISPKMKQGNNGKIYLFGKFTRYLDFDTLQINNIDSNYEVNFYVATLDLTSGWVSAHTLYARNETYQKGSFMTDRGIFPVFAMDDSYNVYVSEFCGMQTSYPWDAISILFNNGSIVRGVDRGMIAKFDSSGNLLWYNNNLSIKVKGISCYTNNEIILYGDYSDFMGVSSQNSEQHGCMSEGDKDVSIISIDNNGNTNWIDNLGSTGDDDAVFSEKNSCGELYFIGHLQDTTMTNYDTLNYDGDNMFLLHFSPSGNCIYGCDTMIATDNFNNMRNKNNVIKIYPNPTDENINVLVPNNESIKHLVLYDVFGKIVINKNTKNNVLNLRDLKPGIYLIKVITNKNNYYSKFIKS